MTIEEFIRALEPFARDRQLLFDAGSYGLHDIFDFYDNGKALIILGADSNTRGESYNDKT